MPNANVKIYSSQAQHIADTDQILQHAVARAQARTLAARTDSFAARRALLATKKQPGTAPSAVLASPRLASRPSDRRHFSSDVPMCAAMQASTASFSSGLSAILAGSAAEGEGKGGCAADATP